MSSTSKYYVLIFGVILHVFPAGHSIRCYQCSSHVHSECADIDSNTTDSPLLHKCEQRENHQMFCRKTVQKILDSPDIAPRITRTCGWYINKSNISNCVNSDTDFKLERNCQCFTDACNTGAGLVPVKLFGVVGLVAAWLPTTC